MLTPAVKARPYGRAQASPAEAAKRFSGDTLWTPRHGTHAVHRTIAKSCAVVMHAVPYHIRTP